MRTTPLIGDKAWFAPRRLGWGLDPVSPEGWVVTLVTVVAAVVVGRARRGPRWLPGVLVVAFVVVAALKGTTPGGPRARAAYDAAHAAD